MLPLLLIAVSLPDVHLTKVSAVRHLRGGDLYADILSHAPRPYTTADRNTNAHESTHDVDNALANHYGMDAFYIGKGNAVLLTPPQGVSKRQAEANLPPCLRGQFFNDYFHSRNAGIILETGQECSPLYLWDELMAYTNGGKVSVEDAKNGRADSLPRTYADGTTVTTGSMCGCVEHAMYGMALAKAIHDHNPAYWKGYPKARKFIIWLLKEDLETFLAGRDLYPFESQEQQLRAFLRSRDAAPLRKFCYDELDGAWVGRFKPNKGEGKR